MPSCYSLSLKLFTLASNLIVDGDSLTTEGIQSKNMDDDDDMVLMLPSSQLSELDQVYKSGGQDAARQLLQSQSMEQVYYKTALYFYQTIRLVDLAQLYIASYVMIHNISILFIPE